MFLKSLELHGFKSFPNRTVLTFERGATVIVGPNGSGKSNISDAMRWVLGELSSRNIRGTKMTDVIFGGTAERRPMGFAEVTVVFDNSDPNERLDSEFDEVSVTRRYYRNGNSEYLINKEPKRLRDISELFMNTGVGREGYSIIGQGKIAEIISKKSDERRTIFEEAAGISKYRHRKEESERKLEATQLNLDRVKDVLSELENRVGPLEKEAEKARKGLAIYEEKKRADVSLWLYDTKQIQDDIKQAENDFALAKRDFEIIENAIADLHARDEALLLKAQQNKILSEQLYNEIHDTTELLHKLDSAMSVAESDFAHSNEQIEECHRRLTAIADNRKMVEGRKAEYDARIAQTQQKIKEMMDERLDVLTQVDTLRREIERRRTLLEDQLTDITAEENLATDLRVRLNVLESAKVSEGTRTEDVKAQIEKYEAEESRLEEEAARAAEKTSGFKEKIEEKDGVIAACAEETEALEEKKEQVIGVLNAARLEKDRLLQRADVLERMTENLEGFSGGTKYVMKHSQEGRFRGTVYGPLSTLISSEKKYVVAIETALGASLQNIVVDNDQTAKECMVALKNDRAGRCTFYPVSTVRPLSETDEIRQCAKYAGYVGRADKLVSADGKFRSIIESLLLRTVIFDTLDNANAAAKGTGHRVKIVSLDGQVCNAGGSYTGGSIRTEGGLLSRQSEIEKLKADAADLDRKIKKTQAEADALDAQIEAKEAEAKDAAQDKDILLTLSRAEFAALDTANANLSANRNMLEKLRLDLANLMGEQDRVTEEIASVRADFEAAGERIEALKSVRAKNYEETGVLDERADEYDSKANEIYIKITALRGDEDAARQMSDSEAVRLGEVDAEAQAQKDRIAELQTLQSEIGKKRSESRNDYDTLHKKLDELDVKRRETDSGSDDFERERNEISARLREKNAGRDVYHESMLRTENTVANLHEKQEKLGSVLWDEYELAYEDALALQYPPVTAENREEIAQLQVSAKNRLRNLGGYNPSAIEEYAEVKTRYDDLSGQVRDLTNSYDELNGIISRLEVEMRQSFTDAFNEISKNFGVTFRELFGGGSASLSLTDPEDVLTSGIEINAQPPGKAVGSMSLLSGGEQSFVAIALLFAILKVNPSPFCILDEIEAALDEVNVFRFGEYIKKMSGGTQFILITHRRGTMEVGDRLYGVTMPQRGISQAIELNVNEIEGNHKEVLDGVL